MKIPSCLICIVGAVSTCALVLGCAGGEYAEEAKAWWGEEDVDVDSYGGYESQPEAMGAPGTQKRGYFATRVFYATDRASEGTGGQIRFVGRRGGGELAYGSVEVSIPDTHKVGEIESKKWYRVWESESPTRHVLVMSIDPYSGQAQFVSEMRTLLSEAGRNDAMVFIHGYNVEFEEAAKRTGQMAYDLRFTGAPIFYSWPSRGGFDDYPADEASIQWTVPHLDSFLRFALTELGAENVHVIAHSMGNRALVPVLSRLDLASLPPGSAKLKQIILAAPDVDAEVFQQLAASFPGKADRITLYSSSKDKAIRASHKFHKEPRAGGSIVIVDGVDTIDASNVQSDFLNHSYFGNSIVSDIHSLVANGLPPDQRFGLRAQSDRAGRYWQIVAGGG